MGFTLKEICEAVGGYTEGDATITVNSVSEPGLATERWIWHLRLILCLPIKLNMVMQRLQFCHLV